MIDKKNYIFGGLGNKNPKNQAVNNLLNEDDLNLSEEEMAFKRKYLKARNRTIDLFGKHMDTIKLKNEIKEQRDEIERQRKKIELSYKRARKRTIDLYGKHNDLKKAKKWIEFQQKELIKTNAELKNKNDQINDSIDYAKKIQEAILPAEDKFTKCINDYFIYYKPRDIVSGDFYWFYKKNKKLYIAVADCTGHGVPGAFMSVMSNTMLNSIMAEEKNHTPSSILKKLNNKVVTALKQDSSGNVQADGMDISLCCIDMEKRELEISCADQDAYLIIDNHLHTIESSLFSVGGNLSNSVEPEYDNQTYHFTENTYLYLFTDGFKDQFGGDKNKKYGLQQIKNLLNTIQDYDFTKQKQIIDNEFLNWKSSGKQIDDVLVLGIDLNSIKLGSDSIFF